MGHIAKECRNDVTCYNCGKPGHKSRDCTVMCKTVPQQKNCPCCYGGACLYLDPTPPQQGKVLNAKKLPVGNNIVNYHRDAHAKRFPQSTAVQVREAHESWHAPSKRHSHTSSREPCP